MYDIINQADTLRSFKIERMILNPNLWGNYPNRIPLVWKKIKFNESQLEYVPNDKLGVYSFVAMPEIANHIACAYLLYVGRAGEASKPHRNFRVRFKEYLRDQKGPTKRVHIFEMLNKWKDHLWFCYAPIDELDQIVQIEKDLLEAYVPPYNKDFQGTIVQEPMKVLR